MFRRIFSARRGRLLLAAGVVLAIPVAAIAWWLGSPLFINRTVDEQFEFGGTRFTPSEMSATEVDAVMAAAAAVDVPMLESMTAEMAAAAVVKSGQFHDADSFHKGSGKATIYQLPDGARVLRLEDFRVTNGPDLHVVLSPHPDPSNRDDVTVEGYVDLGSLKGNIGNQNYVLPDADDPATFGSVVIYCKPFRVVFSVAPLSDSN
ncbi:MAG: DM13 domain-containing protein [Chloroflexi bacterium]|nr:DM13 domain-containing protein [Chloroflexota bacterium]